MLNSDHAWLASKDVPTFRGLDALDSFNDEMMNLDLCAQSDYWRHADRYRVLMLNFWSNHYVRVMGQYKVRCNQLEATRCFVAGDVVYHTSELFKWRWPCAEVVGDFHVLDLDRLNEVKVVYGVDPETAGAIHLTESFDATTSPFPKFGVWFVDELHHQLWKEHYRLSFRYPGGGLAIRFEKLVSELDLRLKYLPRLLVYGYDHHNCLRPAFYVNRDVRLPDVLTANFLTTNSLKLSANPHTLGELHKAALNWCDYHTLKHFDPLYYQEKLRLFLGAY